MVIVETRLLCCTVFENTVICLKHGYCVYGLFYKIQYLQRVYDSPLDFDVFWVFGKFSVEVLSEGSFTSRGFAVSLSWTLR